MTTMPEDLGVSSVTELHLQHNEFSVLPSSVSEMVNLRQLYLNNNKLQELPDTICAMRNMEVVIICILLLPVWSFYINYLFEEGRNRMHLMGSAIFVKIPGGSYQLSLTPETGKLAPVWCPLPTTSPWGDTVAPA